LRRQREWASASLVDIKTAIDQDYYILSCAHYERYIAPGELLV